MTKEIAFPENFWWGAATSGPQSEGTFDKPHENLMDYWYRCSPEDFHNGIGPDVASDFYHRYKEDLSLMKEIGFNSFRTSIQWSRLIKDLETGEPDAKAVQYYNSLIEEAEINGIELVFNLHHFDLPIELFEKYGGWESKKVVELYVKYAHTCFKLFGDKINYWATFNEPMVIPEAGYLYGHHFPNFSGKGREAVQVMYNLNLASAKTINLFKSMHLEGEIGIILNLTPSYPESDAVEDGQAGVFADEFFNKAFLDPAVKGTFPEHLVETLAADDVLWESTPEELDEISTAKVDFLGVNYYHPKRVRGQRDKEKYLKNWMPDKYFEEYFDKNRRINPYRGWEIYPQAIYEIGKNIQENYDNIPWFISENGMGVENESRFKDENGFIHDDYRIDFYKEHLTYLAQAIEEGSQCFGYHTWAAMDCWSWNNAYKNRYGFISVDPVTQERVLKKSAYWYAALSETNTFINDHLEEENKTHE